MPIREIYNRLTELLNQLRNVTETDTDNGNEEKNSIVNDEVDNKEISAEKDATNNNVVENTLDNTSNENEEDVDMPIAMNSRINNNTGLFDIDDNDDELIRERLREANEYITNKNNQVLLNESINQAISAVRLNNGISADVVRAMLLQNNGVRVENGKVVGVSEAMKDLQSKQAGLFATTQNNASNPTMEGFNPTKVDGADYRGLSITQALRMSQK